MEITSQEILKKLPDFNDLLSITDEIADAIVEKLTIEKDIKTREAEVVRIATTESVYFIGGKPPSMSYIEAAYIYNGLDGELSPYRASYIKAVAKLDRLRSRLDLYKEFLSMWRSLNASERAINA